MRRDHGVHVHDGPELPRKGTAQCRRARHRVYNLIGGHMSAREKAEVWRHMKKCGNCFSHYEFAKIMRNLVRKSVKRELCPVFFMRRVKAAVFRSKRA